MFGNCLQLYSFFHSVLLTMVVSAMEPKLLMKMLHETLTGGPTKKKTIYESNICYTHTHTRTFLHWSFGVWVYEWMGVHPGHCKAVRCYINAYHLHSVYAYMWLWDLEHAQNLSICGLHPNFKSELTILVCLEFHQRCHVCNRSFQSTVHAGKQTCWPLMQPWVCSDCSVLTGLVALTLQQPCCYGWTSLIS